MENKPILSICIVSFNRKERIINTINSIREYPSDDLEIIVSDDGSTDGTIDGVRRISELDHRVKLLDKPNGLGAIKNWMYSLSEGNGKYVMTLNDRDSIEVRGLPEFIDFLKENKDIVAGYCDPYMHSDSIISYSGYNILLNGAYRSLHPSGFFFDKEVLIQLPAFQNNLEFFKMDDVGYWPHDFVLAECFNEGNVVFYNKKLVIKADNEFIKDNKSGVDKSEAENLWFAPKQRYEQMIRIFRHIDTFKLDIFRKFILKNKIYYRQLNYSTVIYKSYRANIYECSHYNIDTKIVNEKEIVDIVKMFNKKFRQYMCGKKHLLYRVTTLLLSKYILKKFGL
jgi:glycosyltransferase involved in cell wall biosynthesis